MSGHWHPSAYGRWLLLFTPLLMVLDYGFGWNVRVAMLGDSRIWYYLMLLALGWAAWRNAAWLGLAALLESALNLTGLIVSSWLQVLTLPQTVDGGSFQSPLGWQWLVNFLLVGGVQVIYFHQNMRGWFRQLRGEL